MDKALPEACGAFISNTNSSASQPKDHGSRPQYQCDWIDKQTGSTCGRVFNQKGNLVQHMRMHMGIRLYPC